MESFVGSIEDVEGEVVEVVEEQGVFLVRREGHRVNSV